MGKKPFKVSEKEQSLVQALRESPELLKAVEAVLESSDACQGQLLSADEVEEALIKDVRGVGRAAMTRWASQAEERLAQEFKSQASKASARKKKS
jgi:hypothetical protein